MERRGGERPVGGEEERDGESRSIKSRGEEEREGGGKQIRMYRDIQGVPPR